MKAILLAAGEGTRLRSLTLTRPKPMLPIGGKPVLEHLVDLCREHGCRDLAINLHYRPETIVRHFGDGERFGVRIVYSHEPRLLGSAGAVRRLADFFDETFLVVYGDLFTRANLSALVERHRTSGAAATIALHRVADPWNRGVVVLDAAGQIRQFIEKPPRESNPDNLVNAGIYVVEPRIVADIPPGQPYDFGYDLFPRLLANGERLVGHELAEELIDIGTPDAYQATCARFGG